MAKQIFFTAWKSAQSAKKVLPLTTDVPDGPQWGMNKNYSACNPHALRPLRYPSKGGYLFLAKGTPPPPPPTHTRAHHHHHGRPQYCTQKSEGFGKGNQGRTPKGSTASAPRARRFPPAARRTTGSCSGTACAARAAPRPRQGARRAPGNSSGQARSETEAQRWCPGGFSARN